MTDIHALIRQIEDFSRETGMSPDAVCRSATNNPRLYSRLIARGAQTKKDADRIMSFIADHSKQQPERAG